ncbi:hypothetical protein RRF57_000250 [Xylaria bambusicola]|uniref:Uncharacterized protein n=1 Tax=Xylaria bambusicola TaxID=326684 RepID=A0AAN7U9H9_9PEZI
MFASSKVASVRLICMLLITPYEKSFFNDGSPPCISSMTVIGKGMALTASFEEASSELSSSVALSIRVHILIRNRVCANVTSDFASAMGTPPSSSAGSRFLLFAM